MVPLITNTRWRMLITIGMLIATVSVSYVPALLGACLFFLCVLWWCGISLREIAKRYLLIVPFALGALVLLPFSTEGEPMFAVLGLVGSAEGVHQSLVLFLKISAANFLLTYLLVTTPQFELLKQLRALGVPELLVSIMQMMLRYFYLLIEEVRSMVKAQRARGLRLERWLWSRLVLRRFGQMMGALFARSYSRSAKIYFAMAARGGVRQGGVQEVGVQHGVVQQVGANSGGHTNRRGVAKMAIAVRNVSFYYGEYQALRNVSFELPRGSKTALLGSNGAGKSTLISLLNGLEVPSMGEVALFDEPLTKESRALAHRRVGVVYQDPDDQIFSPTVEEDVAFGPRNLGLSEAEVDERVERALASVGLREFRGRSPFELSYGQKRRVAIAGVLAMQPEVIIMDEPMAFLDPHGRAELQALLESLHLMGLTIMIATHDIDFACEWTERVIILQNGAVYADDTVDVLFDETLLAGAKLPLPRLVQPFRLLGDEASGVKPRSVREAAQWIWRLMMRRQADGQTANNDKEEHG